MDYIKIIVTAKDQLTSASAQKILLSLFGVVLAFFIARTSASLSWKVVALTSAPMVDVVAGKGSTPQNIQGFSVTSRVTTPSDEIPLFGQAGKRERSSALSRDSGAAPETTLELVLRGIITAEPKIRALAIIAEKNKDSTENLYGIGDKVPGNAVISEIFADRLILRRGGVFETLLLEDQGPPNLPKTRAGQRVADNAIVDLGDGVHWEIDNDYLNQRLNDISSLAREVGVEVYKEDNVQKGYRLVSARGSKLLRDMGLQPGDILHEVNGVQLNTIQAGLSIYQQMRNAQQIRVVIGRNGRRETRIYEINSGG